MCVLMVVSLLPANAFAAVNSITNLYVGGTDILTQTDYKIEYGTDSYAQYDSTTSTLTLHNANISIASAGSKYTGIYAKTGSTVSKGLTIKLEGDNTITTNATKYTTYYGIYVGTSVCKLTITSDNGDGTLAIDKVNYGIYLDNTSATTNSNCTVTMDNVILYGLYVKSTLAITDVNLGINYTASNTTAKGIYSYNGAATITNSVVNINCTVGYGFYSLKKTNNTLLTVDNSSLTCTVGGDHPAILTTSVNVIGNSTVIADGGVDLCADNSTYSSYSYLTLTPSGEALGILVGSSADKNSVYGTYEETTTLSQPSGIEYATYAYVKITTGAVGTGNSVRGIIYLNEDYHAAIITRSGRRYFACIPHTVDSNGYCTVCKEYIGGEEEETVTIDGVEYTVAYSEDIDLASGDWDTTDLSDASLVEALATEGSVLVVTRSEETNIVFDTDAATYEKFGLVNSWWSGDWIVLGTAGYVNGDEDGITAIDCISDDGTTVMYDGITVYNEWVARGMNAGGSALFITNTSGSYTITNISVLVPVE